MADVVDVADVRRRDRLDMYAYQMYISVMDKSTQPSAHSGRPGLKSERVMARVSSEQKRLLQRAAEIRGQTLTEFVVAAAQEAATRAIVDHEVIELSVRDSRAFAEGVLDPPPVNATLQAAARRYKKAMAL